MGENNSFGKLFIVATPIGNLGDLSPRAVDTLRGVDLILCEDTRHFNKLATHFAIATKVRSYHDHNERQCAEGVIEELKNGAQIALVSDAGTPLISDPGYRLVSLASAQGIAIKVVPGPCAATAALSISGFEIDRFVFNGFLSQKSGKRKRQLQEMLDSTLAQVFYESTHRIVKSLGELAELNSEREIFVARELTKLHEETFRGTAAAYLKHVENGASTKGEFVVVIRGDRCDRTDDGSE